MNITTISDTRYKTYEYCSERTMQMVEMNLNIIFSKFPHLISSVDRSVIHHLIRDYRSIQINIQ